MKKTREEQTERPKKSDAGRGKQKETEKNVRSGSTEAGNTTSAPNTSKTPIYEQLAQEERRIRRVRETAAAYGADLIAWKRQGEYTVEDYLALPEEQRVELIDGVIYDMGAPTTGHQGIGGYLHAKLLEFALKKKGPCMPFMSPVDVQLDEDDRTMVQPDVLIVCDRSKLQNGRVFGAPDFLVEVFSPSTRKKDMQLKLYKYSHAGVREYWMVDPEKKVVIVYDFEHEEIPKIYGIREKIPVMIWGGECVIDFEEIYEYVGFLYEQ